MRRCCRLIALVFIDFVLISTALGGACLLSDVYPTLFSRVWFVAAAIAVIVNIIVFVRTGLYRAILKYASVDSLVAVIKAVTLGNLGTFLFLYIIRIHLPTRILIINWLLTVFLVGGSRFIVRYYLEFVLRYRRGHRVLIYGAGDLGVIAMRQLKQDKSLSCVPVGFIDDDIRKGNNLIHSIQVLGTWRDLDKILSKVSASEVVVAVSGIEGEKLRKVVKDCRQRNLRCRIIPSFTEVFKMKQMIREVEVADLLRRGQRDLNGDVVDRFIEGKKVLITGAAGSIGSELVRQCLKHNPSEIIAIDQSEEGIYHLQEELDYDDCVKYILADVASADNIKRIFELNRPHIVFHAAAYKHVHVLESNVTQAVINNIEGTRVVATAADKCGVEKFVLISTDKAVKPSSVMGATKRVCELFIQNFKGKGETEFVAVRFGNVLGSSGSVIPKFIEQIHAGGPVTVTHPDATRYFMLVSEAVQLVLQAASIGDGGSIFILDMGSPVKIVEMAEDLIYLMGRKPYEDIAIKFTNLRPGEKINEELFSEEIDSRTRYENITVAKATLLDWEWFREKLDHLIFNAREGCEKVVVDQLNHLVSERSFRKIDGHLGLERRPQNVSLLVDGK